MARDHITPHDEHKQSITIPNTPSRPSTACEPAGLSPIALMTPKTPADDAIEFFSSAPSQGEGSVHVYELRLDPDGGPNKDRQVS